MQTKIVDINKYRRQKIILKQIEEKCLEIENGERKGKGFAIINKPENRK